MFHAAVELALRLGPLHLQAPLDPLHGDGYQWWSGLGSDLAYLGIFATWWHHVNCVEPGCWRKGHKDPGHGHPLCKRHQGRLPA